MRSAAVVVLLASVAIAGADDAVAVLEPKPAPFGPAPHANPMPAAEAVPAPAAEPHRDALRPQLQVDGGLSVIGPGYEHPIARHLAVQLEVFVFGTYFLPWFDAGERVVGFGAGVRPTWFLRATGRGLYVAPYFRVVGVDGESITGANGIGFTTGAFAGWAFGLGDRLDLRIGAGAQLIHFHTETEAGRISTTTPFVALDAVLGYRL